MDRVLLEQLLDKKLSLAEIGRRVGLHEATVSYWVRKHGLQAVGAGRYSAKGALTRDQLEPLVDAGMSIAQIAEAVGRGKATVRHWLARYELKTSGRAGGPRAAALSEARENGLAEITLSCIHHGEGRFVCDVRGYYRCVKCRSAAVSRRRRRVKQQLVNEAGGCCAICGYDRCAAALQFHHLDPSEKAFTMAYRGVSRSLDKARKCMLLCANCHAEVEAGIETVA